MRRDAETISLGANTVNGNFSGKMKFVMAGHSRPKDGVASLAYVPAISLRDARIKCARF